jgi:hypothetical protein
VVVSRPSKWGNPFRITETTDATEVVRLFRRELRYELLAMETGDPLRSLAMRRIAVCLRDLRGRDLACWCKPGSPCHADVLMEVANA